MYEQATYLILGVYAAFELGGMAALRWWPTSRGDGNSLRRRVERWHALGDGITRSAAAVRMMKDGSGRYWWQPAPRRTFTARQQRELLAQWERTYRSLDRPDRVCVIDRPETWG